MPGKIKIRIKKAEGRTDENFRILGFGATSSVRLQ